MIWIVTVFAVEILSNASSAAGCIAIGESAIPASALSAGIPELQILDPGLVIARTPELGIRRVIAARQLNLILGKYAPGAKLVDPVVSVCVVRQSRKITEEEVRMAIAAALSSRGEPHLEAPSSSQTVEILEFSVRLVGEGELYFPPQSQAWPGEPGTPVIWRGWHKGRSGQRVPVWAKVRLSERVAAPFATRDLKAGESIVNGSIVYREVVRFPAPETSPLEDPIGKVAKRLIHAGEPVLPKDLGAEVAVRRGDAVDVQVQGGAILLRFNGKAEGSGQPGQKIAVSSSLSKRMFQAVVKEKGHVVVTVDAAVGGVAGGKNGLVAAGVSGREITAASSGAGVRRLP